MDYFPPTNGDLLDPDRPYINANPVAGIRGSRPHAKAIEGAMREIVNAIVASGLTPDGEDFTQLSQALSKMTIPVGSEISWQNSTIPAGWLEQNGATFDEEIYPALYIHLGSNVLPDMRGVFARGWDHGRGIDTGRALGTSQLDSIQNIVGAFRARSGSADNALATGAFQRTNTSDVGYGANTNAQVGDFTFDASRVVRTSTETRPRNIAKIWLIKAL